MVRHVAPPRRSRRYRLSRPPPRVSPPTRCRPTRSGRAIRRLFERDRSPTPSASGRIVARRSSVLGCTAQPERCAGLWPPCAASRRATDPVVCRRPARGQPRLKHALSVPEIATARASDPCRRATSRIHMKGMDGGPPIVTMCVSAAYQRVLPAVRPGTAGAADTAARCWRFTSAGALHIQLRLRPGHRQTGSPGPAAEAPRLAPEADASRSGAQDPHAVTVRLSART